MSGRKNDKMWATMVKKHGSEEAARKWYQALGKRGGQASSNGGFFNDPERAAAIGKLGGQRSRRGYKLQPDGTYIETTAKTVPTASQDPIQDAMTDFANRSQGIR